ncbi:MAG: hypothetical protein LBM26_02690 [Methanobrevibacter sp.]|jgi:uncharacterized protein YbjQ (UPF0145 family)|nr:hypothetical protein [Methanobrevibacter sp.]
MILTEYRKIKIKKFLIAISCIAIGTFIGIISLFLSYFFKIAIFGFNLGLIFSPIIAGYVETFFAQKYYGKTTGAVSAFILFITTVLYGFIYMNTGLGFNAITIGSAAVILQAAFPTLINYFLVVVILGIISYISGIFKNILNKIYSQIRHFYFKLEGNEYIETKGEMDYDEEQSLIDINKMGILFLSSTHSPDHEIKKFNGIYEGKILIQNPKKIISMSSDNKNSVLLKNLQKAQQQAIINLGESAKEDNSNAILDLTIEFDTLGGLKEDNIHIVARGTGVELK